MSSAIVPRRTLFDVSAEWVAFDNLLEETGGELVNPEAQSAVDLWFAELEQAESQKMSGYVAYIRQLEMEADAAKQIAASFQAKAKARENRIAYLKGRMRDYLIASGRSKATTTDGQTIAVQKNGGKIPMDVDAVDPATLPIQFLKVITQVDNEAVRAALEDGEVLEFARLLPVGSHLRIR